MDNRQDWQIVRDLWLQNAANYARYLEMSERRIAIYENIYGCSEEGLEVWVTGHIAYCLGQASRVSEVGLALSALAAEDVCAGAAGAMAPTGSARIADIGRIDGGAR